MFMFARDDYQSWQAYKLLFEHLRGAQCRVEYARQRLTLALSNRTVRAQVDPTEVARRRFIDRSYETWPGSMTMKVTTEQSRTSL